MCHSGPGVTGTRVVTRVILCLQVPSNAKAPTVRVAGWCAGGEKKTGKPFDVHQFKE